jgi:hypothetical protein
VLVEAHDRRLGGETVFRRIVTVDRANDVLPPGRVRGLEHHLVLGQVEMTVQERNAEPVQRIVFLEDEPDVFQALRVAFVDRSDIGDVVEVGPLHGLENNRAH